MKQRTGRTGAFYAKEASLQFKEDLQDSSLAAKRLEQSGFVIIFLTAQYQCRPVFPDFSPFGRFEIEPFNR